MLRRAAQTAVHLAAESGSEAVEVLLEDASVWSPVDLSGIGSMASAAAAGAAGSADASRSAAAGGASGAGDAKSAGGAAGAASRGTVILWCLCDCCSSTVCPRAGDFKQQQQAAPPQLQQAELVAQLRRELELQRARADKEAARADAAERRAGQAEKRAAAAEQALGRLVARTRDGEGEL